MILRYLEKKIPNIFFRFLLTIYWSSVIWKKMLEFLFLSAWNRRRTIASLIKRRALFYRRPLYYTALLLNSFLYHTESFGFGYLSGSYGATSCQLIRLERHREWTSLKGLLTKDTIGAGAKARMGQLWASFKTYSTYNANKGMCSGGMKFKFKWSGPQGDGTVLRQLFCLKCWLLSKFFFKAHKPCC